MTETSFHVANDVLFQSVDQELVLLNLTSQKYYGLDSMGARMWNLLAEHHRPAAVADRICEEFDADRALVLRDVEAMAADFHAAGLIEKD